MSEITIENIIGHCNAMCEKEGLYGRVNESDYKFYDAVRQCLYELQHYEDLEEQGRLAVLPCKAGESAYTIEGIGWKGYEWRHRTYDKAYVREVKFNTSMLGGYFATKEEAEAKLKELKGE